MNRTAWTLGALVSLLVLAASLALVGTDVLTAEGLLRRSAVVYGLFLAPLAALGVALLFLIAPPTVRWNVLLLVLLFALAEAVFAAIAGPEPTVASEPQSLTGKDYYVADERLGYRLVANNIVNHRKTVDGRAIYDVTYHIDGLGRRVTPRGSAAAPERYLLFFGCSNTFGEGLSQDQTLPYHVTRALPRYRAYNYGLHGYGLSHMLDLVETRDLAHEVEERRGTALYYFIPDHMARLVGASNVSPTWGRGFPRYVAAPDGGVRYEGSFSQGRRWTTFAYALLARSNIVRHFGLVLPLAYDDADFELAARVVAESRRRLAAQVTPDRFAVVLSPTIGDRQRRTTRRFAEALARHGIDVVDLSDKLDLTDRRYRVADDDYHQSGEANAALASHLATWLRESP